MRTEVVHERDFQALIFTIRKKYLKGWIFEVSD
jgi:hypothetical protein